MNDKYAGVHPSEEQLMEFAVSGLPDEVGEHIAACKSCSDAILEFREVKKRMSSYGEEPVPERLERRILNISRHGHVSGVMQAVFSNPFFIALAVAIVVILLFFLVASEVFKTP